MDIMVEPGQFLRMIRLIERACKDADVAIMDQHEDALREALDEIETAVRETREMLRPLGPDEVVLAGSETMHVHVYRVTGLIEYEIETADEEEARRRALALAEGSEAVWTPPDCRMIALVPDERA